VHTKVWFVVAESLALIFLSGVAASFFIDQVFPWNMVLRLLDWKCEEYEYSRLTQHPSFRGPRASGGKGKGKGQGPK